MLSTVYIGLGSNLDDPAVQLRQGLLAITRLQQVTLKTVSKLYRSQPWGKPDQPDFLNAVAKIATSLSPHDLLSALQAIEDGQQRTRDVKWGPRTLDLDILLFDNLELHLPELTLPHPEMLQREFVVYPLYEIAPDLVLPSRQKLAAVKLDLPLRGLKLMGNLF